VKGEEVVVITPLPPKCLSPNHPPVTMRGVMRKANEKRKRKYLVKEQIEAEQIETAPWGHCDVKAVFYCKTKRGRDTDNAMGSLKSDYDGIQAAGLVPDDTPEYMERIQPTFEIDREYPRVEMIITRTERKPT
jgi:crossover junction endodeoxyribonuclease RusA